MEGEASSQEQKKCDTQGQTEEALEYNKDSAELLYSEYSKELSFERDRLKHLNSQANTLITSNILILGFYTSLIASNFITKNLIIITITFIFFFLSLLFGLITVLIKMWYRPFQLFLTNYPQPISGIDTVEEKLKRNEKKRLRDQNFNQMLNELTSNVILLTHMKKEKILLELLRYLIACKADYSKKNKNKADKIKFAYIMTFGGLLTLFISIFPFF